MHSRVKWSTSFNIQQDQIQHLKMLHFGHVEANYAHGVGYNEGLRALSCCSIRKKGSSFYRFDSSALNRLLVDSGAKSPVVEGHTF